MQIKELYNSYSCHAGEHVLKTVKSNTFLLPSLSLKNHVGLCNGKYKQTVPLGYHDLH